jgi:hypothetical protein
MREFIGVLLCLTEIKLNICYGYCSQAPVTSLFLWGYVKDIVYKTRVLSLDELKLRIVAATETVTPKMLNTLRETGYRLDILRGRKGAHVEVVWHSPVLNLQVIKLFELHFHIPLAVSFCCFRFENYGPWKPRQ